MTSSGLWQTLLEDPPIRLRHALLGEPQASAQLASLNRRLDWQRPLLRIYGREHLIPREQIWMGDPDARYRYSGKDFIPSPWHPNIEALREIVEATLQEVGIDEPFNSVLLNRYRHGQERMGWHSDDEQELGPDPLIAAVSLGAERPLRFRWRDKRAEAFNLWLPHDSLLIMSRGTQHLLQHALLPRRQSGIRISLTFRHVIPVK